MTLTKSSSIRHLKHGYLELEANSEEEHMGTCGLSETPAVVCQ